MKRLVLSLVLSLAALSALAQEEPRTGWSFVPMPNISYNTDIGLNLGAFCDFFYYGDGTVYPNFQHHISVAGAWATKGSWYLHGMFESSALIPGIRFNASVTWRDARLNNFYGFNGYFSPFDASRDLNRDTRTAFYTNRRRFFRVATTLEGALGGAWKWAAGGVYRYVNVGDFALRNYDSGNSLYLKYIAHDLIHADEASGGHSLELKAGVTCDTRDIVLAPRKGLYAEAYLLGNADLSRWKYNYAQIVLHWRHYVPIGTDRIIFAYHLGFQDTFAGDIPFYNLNEIATLNYLYEEYSGLGSRYTVRGYLYTAFSAKGYAWGNFEFRLTPFRFMLWNRQFDIVFNPFVDVGLINPGYRLEQQRALASQGDFYVEGARQPLFVSAGCGAKLHMNTNFILSIDAGHAFSSPLGALTVSMGTTYVF